MVTTLLKWVPHTDPIELITFWLGVLLLYLLYQGLSFVFKREKTKESIHDSRQGEHTLKSKKSDPELKAHYHKMEIEVLTSMINILPESESSTYYSRRGNEYFRMNRYAEALADYNKALQLNPEHNEYLYFRGLIFKAMGDTVSYWKDIKQSAILGNEEANKLIQLNGTC